MDAAKRCHILYAAAVALLALGCGSGPTPVSPSTVASTPPAAIVPATPPPTPPPATPPATGTTFVWAMVLQETGVCIPGASIEIVSGQRAGERVVQKTPCNAWGEEGGVVFTDVSVGVPIALRASAVNFESQERVVIPVSNGQMAILFEPSRVH